MDADVIAALAAGRPIVEYPGARTSGVIAVEWRDGRAIRICAHRCGLTEVPALDALDALVRLDIGDNRVTRLPALPASLRELYIYDNQIAALPALPAISILDANRNRIETLPPLVDLTFGYLAENQLRAVPELHRVAYLNVCDNPLGALVLADPDLRELRAERAQLTRVELDLPALRELSLRGNALQALALRCPALRTLDLRGNALDALPDLRALPLVKLDLRWNPLRAAPAWLDELRAGDCLVYT